MTVKEVLELIEAKDMTPETTALLIIKGGI